MEALGRQFLLELKDCDRDLLNDLDRLRKVLLEAAKVCGATVLSDSFHRFEPQGISGVVVIAESHICIHTWPEHGYAAADIFTCGSRVVPEKAAEVLIRELHAKMHSVLEMRRGIMDLPR